MPPYTAILIKHFEKEMQRYGIHLNVFASAAKNRELGGAKALKEACEGDIDLAKRVITLWLSNEWERKNAPSLTRCAQIAVELIAKVQQRDRKPDYMWARFDDVDTREWMR